MGNCWRPSLAWVVLVAIATWLLHNRGIARMVLGVIALGIVVIFAKETIGLKGAPRRRMIVAFLLMVEAIVFFVLYSQDAGLANFFSPSVTWSTRSSVSPLNRNSIRR